MPRDTSVKTSEVSWSPNAAASSIALRAESPKLASAAVTAVRCARSLVGHSELVLLEERSLDGDVNRPFGRRAESPRTFCDRIRIVLDRLRNLVEEFMDSDERGPTHIPMRLLDLCMQIDGCGQVPVQQLSGLGTDVLGKRIGRAVHLCSPQSKRSVALLGSVAVQLAADLLLLPAEARRVLLQQFALRS